MALNSFKEFLAGLQLLKLNNVHILLQQDVSKKLKRYERHLEAMKLREGTYHLYYGQIKMYVTSFVIFFADIMDEVIKEADRCANLMNKQDLMSLLDKTESIHIANQAEFLKDFVPATTLEQNLYDDVVKRYDCFMKEWMEFKENVNKLNKQEKIDEFAREHFKISVEELNRTLNFAHNYIAKRAAEHVVNVRISIEEILLRLRNNLKRLNEEREEKMNCLLRDLYDKNKENIGISRCFKRSSLETAEVNKCMERIREKIKCFEEDMGTERLEEEVAHWSKKVAEVRDAEEILDKLNKEYDNCVKQEEIYNKLRTTELPGHKKDCWETIGENFTRRKQWVKEKILNAQKSVITIFCCRGNDRVIYKDNIGEYYVDEFNHQVYVQDHFLKVYHLNCAGDFIEVHESQYYFDRRGRYILEGDKKIYHSAPCRSSYNLLESGLMEKVTDDCGHSDRATGNCRLEIKDLTDVEILPKTEPVDIRRTLAADTAKYLWDALGGALPDALRCVGTRTPKNPIHYLAHMLIAHKCERTRCQRCERRIAAQKYRENVHKERQERAAAANLPWKARQVKGRKPEESDDLPERTVHGQQMAREALHYALYQIE